MITIKVNKDDIRCDDEDVERYMNVLHGLAVHCKAGGYRMGWRNEIAVNLTVAANMLGLSPKRVLLEFECGNLIDPASDDESPYDRVERVLGYDFDFSWDWMIDADEWEATGIKERESSPIEFVIS